MPASATAAPLSASSLLRASASHTTRLGARLRSRALRIAGSYAIFATLWILFSDQALEWFEVRPEQLVSWSVFKGLAFVAITTVLLLLLMHRTYGAMERNHRSLQAHEAEIQRLNRLYSALSHINQAITRGPPRPELFARICRVLVEHGGLRLAWIGWFDADTQLLEPAAIAGGESEHIRQARIYADDRPEGRGPIGRAFRENRPYICNDLRHDPLVQPWRDEIIRRGFRALACLPISDGDSAGGVGGVLSVYADEAGFFEDEEVKLLREAVSDIAFALANLARHEEHQRAEASARNERRFSDTMIESMPGVLYFYDSHGRFLRWNRNFETVSGYSAAEIGRMHPLDFFRPEDRLLLQARIAEVFARGESLVEAPFRAKDGRTTPYLFTGRRVEFDGETCLVGAGIDLTELKQTEAALHEAEGRLRTVVENLREGLIIADPSGEFLHWNPAALTLLGFASAEEGREQLPHFARIFALFTLDGEQLPAPRWPLARVRAGETVDRLELRVTRPGTDWERIISYSGSQVRYAGERTLAFLTLRDITTRKQAERVLRDTNELLERRVAERTSELQSALVRAEAADRIKSAFLATMSHELRTPLNSIIGFTGIILQGLAGPLNEEQHRQLGMVRGSARHLLELINDVLDISKIEAGQLEVRAEAFDLRDSLQRVTATVRPLAEKKHLDLSLQLAPDLPALTSDRRRVEQILLNLLNNAIKFTEHGSVTLAADLLPAHSFTADPAADGGGERGSAVAVLPPATGPAVRLRVTDTGIGIKPGDLGTLFQPFRQIDSGLSRQHDGTGLGLAICRRLASLLGGEITAASEWGRGSEFTVILPFSRPDQP